MSSLDRTMRMEKGYSIRSQHIIQFVFKCQHCETGFTAPDIRSVFAWASDHALEVHGQVVAPSEIDHLGRPVG